MCGRIRKGRIVGVYVGKEEMERILKELEEWIRKQRNNYRR